MALVFGFGLIHCLGSGSGASIAKEFNSTPAGVQVSVIPGGAPERASEPASFAARAAHSDKEMTGYNVPNAFRLTKDPDLCPSRYFHRLIRRSITRIRVRLRVRFAYRVYSLS